MHHLSRVKYPFLMQIEHGTQHVRESRNIDTEWSHSNVFVVPEFVIEKELYVRHKKQISPSRSVRTLTAVYNFQMNRLSIEEVKEYLLLVFKDQKTQVEIKTSLAFILRNNEDQTCHYYYASQNNQLLFSEPHFVGNLNDLSDLACKIEQLDLLSRVYYPNSKFSFVRITNVSFFVTKVLRCANRFTALP